MALPVAQDLKNYLRVQTTAEESAIAGILAAAIAMVRGYLDRPITAKVRTYIVEDPRASSFSGSRLSGNLSRAPFLRIPDAPVDTAQDITITDAAGRVLEPDTYRVDGKTGVVRASWCGAYPFTIVATTGLAVLEEYALEIEPAICAAILDVGADLYQRRNPAATIENDGAGGSVQYGRNEETIPSRAISLLELWRRPQL